MKLLLDSHILLWAVFEPEKLPAPVAEVIAQTNNIICVSIASLWEIAIKKSIGRLDIPDEFFKKVQHNSGFELLLMQPTHVSCYLKLPLHHRDPFDRMLIAQAQEERLTFVTCDSVMMQYDVVIFKI